MILDGLLYKNKPDLGLHSLQFINERDVLDGLNINSKFKPKLKENREKILVIDVESIDTQDETSGEYKGDFELSDGMRVYEDIAAHIRTEAPHIRYGFYMVLPQRRYWNRNYIWKARNDYFKPLSKMVDIIFPSLYAFYDDIQGWKDYAIDNINEAKKYNRPVYPFLWPQYHNASSRPGEYIEPDYWRAQVETCLTHADGLVLWGGYNEEWNDQAPWWQIVKEYTQ